VSKKAAVLDKQPAAKKTTRIIKHSHIPYIINSQRKLNIFVYGGLKNAKEKQTNLKAAAGAGNSAKQLSESLLEERT